MVLHGFGLVLHGWFFRVIMDEKYFPRPAAWYGADKIYICEGNNIDFEFTPPFLPKESVNWLIAAIEKAYPNGNSRLERLNTLRPTW